MKNNMDKCFTFKQILKFTLPSIIMMMFFSLYTIVDGIFISNYVGTTALGALNIIYPYQCLAIGTSVMIASGGSAIVGRTLGEHKQEDARKFFTMFVMVEIICAITFLILGLSFQGPILKLLGASDEQMPYAIKYYLIYTCFLPFSFLQNAFQTLFVTAGKPHLGLGLVICAGIMNVFLDYFFLDICSMSIEGAALGTVLACLIPSVTGLLYFSFNRKETLYFVRFKFDFMKIKEAFTNGSSEMVTNLANAISTFLFNYQCQKFYGDDGVASITIILYFQFLFTAILFGYSMGIAPVFSYKYGKNDKKELKSILRRSLAIIGTISVLAYGLSFVLINPVAHLFSGGSKNVFDITVNNFALYNSAFILFGISIFASSYFTALGNGLVSAVISFSRTILFLTIALIVLPIIFKENGIWISVPVAESIGVFVSIFCLIKYRKKYLYDSSNQKEDVLG